LTLHAREAAGDVENVTTTEIEERLAAVTDAFATVLAERTQLTKATLLEPLDAMDKALADAIDALATSDPAAYDHLAEALDHAADAADVLTDGIAELQER
ncbi:MAG TPA: hypothetical protein VGR12_05685, partial [Solirubrobacteraceae bacterium]|nr:hypothetical protein [Solirubrobacteraceae bacterium]